MLKQTSQREKIASPSLTLGLLQWGINSLSLSLSLERPFKNGSFNTLEK